MINQDKTIRFWTFVNGSPVKISVKPNKFCSWYKYERTEEGFSTTSISWEWRENAVEQNTAIRARDCDGPVTFEDRYLLTADRVKAGNLYEGIRYPEWKKMCECQQDLYAERAGY